MSKFQWTSPEMKWYSFLFIVAVLIFQSCLTSYQPEIIILDDWHYRTADRGDFAKKQIDLQGWNSVKAGAYLSQFDEPAVDGYVWFRTKVRITDDLKLYSYLNDSLLFDFKQINGPDEFYLNGRLVGRNGRMIKNDRGMNDLSAFKDISGKRQYTLSAEDSLIHWNETNTLALRIYADDQARLLAAPNPSVSMKDFKDYVSIDQHFTDFHFITRDSLQKDIRIRNHSNHYTFSGSLELSVMPASGDESVYQESREMTLKPGEKTKLTSHFPLTEPSGYVLNYRFIEQNSKFYFTQEEKIPELLTPPTGIAPSINYPRIAGFTPSSAVLFRIPVSGRKPMTISSGDLPAGLTIDQDKPVIRGRLPAAGTYNFTVVANNNHGSDSAAFTFRVGNQISLTPPMTWNNKDYLNCRLEAGDVVDVSSSLVQSGLTDMGWHYVNIYDCWQRNARNQNNRILYGNNRFPDIQDLASQLHDSGLKLGLYSAPASTTCQGYPGSAGNEYTDAWTWNAWDVDYLTYEYCPGPDSVNPVQNSLLRRSVFNMGNALQSISRDIIYHVVLNDRQIRINDNYHVNALAHQSDSIDIREMMYGKYDSIPFQEAGYWHDFGNLSIGSQFERRFDNADQLYSYVSFMALLPSPWMISIHPDSLSVFTRNLLTNKEVIGIHQTSVKRFPKIIKINHHYIVWQKVMSDSSIVYGVFNKKNESRYVDMREITGMKEHSGRDVWRQKTLESLGETDSIKLDAWGVRLIK